MTKYLKVCWTNDDCVAVGYCHVALTFVEEDFRNWFAMSDCEVGEGARSHQRVFFVVEPHVKVF
jgi:hypothetical protein